MLVLAIILLINIGIVNASDVDYKEKLSISEYDNGVVYNYEVRAYYDNDERYTTYKYRHGWSYRTSKPYWKEHHDVDIDDKYDRCRYHKYGHYNEKHDCYDKPRHHKHKNEHDCGSDTRKYRDFKRYDDYWHGKEDDKHKYVKYYDVMDKYETRECYDKAPDDKLFYIKCP